MTGLGHFNADFHAKCGLYFLKPRQARMPNTFEGAWTGSGFPNS